MAQYELIPCDDANSEEAEMIREVDSFLALSRRFSPLSLKVRQITGAALSWGGALTAFWLTFAYKFYFLLLLPILGIFLGTLGYYFTFEYRQPKSVDLLRAQDIVRHDGIKKVFDDLKDARRLGSTKVFLGKEYLFLKGRTMCRIRDIRRVFKREIELDESGLMILAGLCGGLIEVGEALPGYTAALYVEDETGKLTLDVAKLPSMNTEKAADIIDLIRIPVQEIQKKLPKNDKEEN